MSLDSLNLRQLNTQIASKQHKSNMSYFKTLTKSTQKEEVKLPWLMGGGNQPKDNQDSRININDQQELELGELEVQSNSFTSDSDDETPKHHYAQNINFLATQASEKDSIDMKIVQGAYRLKVEKKKLRKELLIYLVFLALFLGYIFSQRPVETLWETTSGMTDYFFDEEFPNYFIQKTYWDIGSFDEIYQWAKGPLANGLQGDTDLTINGRPAFYESNIQIGAIRFRQARIKTGICNHPKDYDSFASDECFPHWKNSLKDTKPFGSPTSYSYTSQKDSNDPSEWGKLSHYEGGGYIVDIPFGDPNFTDYIDEMINSSYLNQQTRALFVDIHLYNPNANHFLSLVAIMEVGAGGCIIPWVQYRIFRLDLYSSASDYGRLVIELIICGFVIWYSYRLVKDFLAAYRYNSKPLRFFMSVWNCVDFVNIGLFWVIIIIQIVYVIAVKIKDLDLASINFVGIGVLGKQYMNFYSIISINIFLTLMKIFKFLKLTKRMNLLWDTLSEATADLIIFLGFFIIVFLSFAVTGFVLFGPSLTEFRDLSESLFKTFEMAQGDIEYSSFRNVNRFLGLLYYVFFVFLVIFVLLNMFLAIINQAYERVHIKTSKGLITQKFQQQLYAMKKFFRKLFGVCRKKKSGADKEDEISDLKILEKMTIISKRKSLGNLSTNDLQQLLGDSKEGRAIFKRIRSQANQSMKKLTVKKKEDKFKKLKELQEEIQDSQTRIQNLVQKIETFHPSNN
ncbi:polycystin-2 [Anaeramoeba ignava]|uniref:Polycystin-2 n=1 Tax=Anaeramoeba ignava TaxID=1746090 RepID=A0A9Q0LVY5_ANAIG|nr:polycystin-2 [Anaeramoeba ignava]